MIIIRPCEAEEDLAVAAELIAELAQWDSAETEKLGFAGQEVLDFYYSAGSALPGPEVRRRTTLSGRTVGADFSRVSLS